MEEKVKNSKLLNWRYCKCGCGGNELHYNGVDLWMYIDFLPGNNGKPDYDKPKYHLHDGLEWIGIFYTREDLDNFVRDKFQTNLTDASEEE